MLRYLISKDQSNSLKGFILLFLFSLNKSLLSVLILYDISVANGEKELNIFLLIAINFFYFIYYFISNFYSEYYLDKFMVNSRNSLNISIYSSIFHHYDSVRLSDYTSIFTNDIPLICETYIQGVISSIYLLMSFLSAALIVWTIDIKMLIYLLLVSIISLIINRYIVNSLSQKQIDFNDTVAMILKKVNETIQNLKHIQIFNMNKEFLKKFSALSKKSSEKQLNIVFSEDKVEIINQSTAVLIEIGMYILSVFLVLNREMTLGSIVAVVASADAITLPVYSFSRLISKFRKTELIRERLLQLLDTNSSLSPNNIQSINTIRINNFSAIINSKKINKNISFTFENGNKYAVLGKNGSGKSTFINILIGSEMQYTGFISINESDLNIIGKCSLLSRISYVSQKVVLFEDTIKNNIILNNHYDSQKYNSILHVLGINNIDEDCMITENQDNLSGGEKQKIMIARALYKDSDILLFDEPLSALDISSRDTLIDYLINIDRRTLIMIMHESNSDYLKEFDSIVKFEKAH